MSSRKKTSVPGGQAQDPSAAARGAGQGPRGICDGPQGLQAAGAGADPQGSADAPMQQIGPEDLVICADDGKFYLVHKSTYMKDLLHPLLVNTPQSLLKLGSVIASANPGDFPGRGSACYVINLPLIRKPRLP